MLSLFITHLQGYKRQAVRSPVFITLEVICELILPLIMAEIVDVAIPAGDTAYIFRLGAVMLALSLLSMAFGMLSAKYATFASQGFGANLRQCLFDKVQEFSFADIDRFSSASLITRMTNDVNAMTMMLNMGLRMLVRAPVMLIAALGISISINPRLAVVLLVVIPLMILAIGILMKICTKLFEVMQTKIDGLNNTLQENLVAIRVVKAFVREDHERKKFQRSNDELMMAGLNVGMKVIAIMPIMMLAMNGATVAVLYLGGKMVMAEGFLLGDLQAFINYIFQILMSVMMVAMALLQLTRAQACAHRINEVLSAEPSVENKPQAQRPAQDELPAPRGRVEFRDVSFKYARAGTGDDVLSQISFTVEPGQFVAIVGGTGTGKSSLVNLIPRFYDVTGGAVLLDGLDVRDYPLEHRHGAAKQCALHRDHSGEPSLGPPGRHGGGDNPGGEGRPGLRFYHGPARWLRHHADPRRHQRLRRTETAAVHCPGHAEKAGGSHSGRLHLRCGQRHRGRHPPILRLQFEGYHRHHHRPAHLVRTVRRRGPDPGRRPHCRTRHP